MLTRLVLLACLAGGIAACEEAMKSLSTSELSARWADAFNNSAESWWYAGDEDGQSVIVIRRPLLDSRFRVSQDAFSFEGIERFPYTKDKDRWVNLKTTNFRPAQ